MRIIDRQLFRSFRSFPFLEIETTLTSAWMRLQLHSDLALGFPGSCLHLSLKAVDVLIRVNCWLRFGFCRTLLNSEFRGRDQNERWELNMSIFSGFVWLLVEFIVCSYLKKYLSLFWLSQSSSVVPFFCNKRNLYIYLLARYSAIILTHHRSRLPETRCSSLPPWFSEMPAHLLYRSAPSAFIGTHSSVMW